MNLRFLLPVIALIGVTASCSDEISAPNPEPVPVYEVLTLITESKHSHSTTGFDTVWVKLNSGAEVKAAKVTYKTKITQQYSENTGDNTWDFEFPPPRDPI